MSKNNGLLLRGDIWHMRFSIKGVMIAESTHTSNRREAEQILARRKSDLIAQTMLGKLKTIKLHDAIDQFQGSRKQLPSYRTCKVNTDLFKTLPNVSLERLTSTQTQSIIEKRHESGSSKATVKNTVMYFNALVNHFAAAGYAVCKKLSPVKGVTGRIRWLTSDEEARLFAALAPQQSCSGDTEVRIQQRQDNYDLVVCLRHSGARLSEISEMHWNQVDFTKGTVHIRRKKGGNDSTIQMTHLMREVLERRRKLDAGEFVFASKVGKIVHTAWFALAVTKAGLSKVGGSVSIHTLRHTAAAKWLNGGLTLPEVQHMLGHKQIASTMVYSHLIPSNVARRAANVINGVSTNRNNTPSNRAPTPRRLRKIKK